MKTFNYFWRRAPLLVTLAKRIDPKNEYWRESYFLSNGSYKKQIVCFICNQHIRIESDPANPTKRLSILNEHAITHLKEHNVLLFI